MEIEIVSSKNRAEIGMGEMVYIYIPMTKREARKHAPNVIDACWRLCLMRRGV